MVTLQSLRQKSEIFASSPDKGSLFLSLRMGVRRGVEGAAPYGDVMRDDVGLVPYGVTAGRVSRPVCKLTLNGANGEALSKILLEEGEDHQHRTGCDNAHGIFQRLSRQVICIK